MVTAAAITLARPAGHSSHQPSSRGRKNHHLALPRYNPANHGRTKFGHCSPRYGKRAFDSGPYFSNPKKKACIASPQLNRRR
jgi:hypothetical protein